MSDNERDGKIPEIPGDNPIRDPEKDVLGRNDVAESFVDHVLRLDVSEGAVVGVFGPWGSGKTSFINLAREKFKERGSLVFDFNPWMFSDTEQLVQRFFTELSREFDIQVGKLAKIIKFFPFLRRGKKTWWLAKIGKIIKFFPFLGLDKRTWWLAKTGKIIKFVFSIIDFFIPGIPSLMKSLGESLLGGKKEIKEQREKISKAIEREFRKSPGIVVLDDVDRLTIAEIRTIVKLVRLTANFPNLIYIVACDRFRIEEVLEDYGLSGRDYLEKIFQLPYNLPETPDQILQEQIEESVSTIARIEKSTYSTPFDQEHWGFVFLGIVEPLIRNMRDVRCYEAAVRGTLLNLRGRVELADVLGLEAVRIFLPDVFRLLPGVSDIITVAFSSGREARNMKDRSKKRVSSESDNNEWERKKIKELREVAKTPERQEIVEQMLHHLFIDPMNSLPEGELLKRRRVAHKDNLRFYLERVPGANLLAL